MVPAHLWSIALVWEESDAHDGGEVSDPCCAAAVRPYGQYDYPQPMGYSPGVMQPQQPYTGQIFQPAQTYTPSAPQSMYSSGFEDEPPLLEGTGGGLQSRGGVSG